MDKGGYKIVDLKDNNITSTPVTITGIYDLLRISHRKVILLSGVTINNTKFHDMFVKVIPIGTEFFMNVYTSVVDNVATQYNIFVEDNDRVTLQTSTVRGAEELASDHEYFTTKEGE